MNAVSKQTEKMTNYTVGRNMTEFSFFYDETFEMIVYDYVKQQTIWVLIYYDDINTTTKRIRHHYCGTKLTRTRDPQRVSLHFKLQVCDCKLIDIVRRIKSAEF